MPRIPSHCVFRALAAWLVLAVVGRAQDKVDFEKQILPIFDTACFKCHSAQAKKVKGEIRLDDVAAIRAKTRTTNLIFPRKPEKSLLVKVISLPEGDEDIMPPADKSKPLAPDQVALIRKWIEQGADFGHWKSAAPRPVPVAIEQEAVDATDVAKTARRIDELVEANLVRNGSKPNPPLADDLWCRRLYLDLAGRIPTYDEINAFLTSRDPARRQKLIDVLLASNGHVSTMFNYWCDTLRARNRLAENVDGEYYLHYIKDSIRTNKPYDRWVREMITAEGNLSKTPAVGYHLRDLGNRFASVDNTSIVFLGTQIGCAQCHDHPYDEWSRKAYHQFAAWMSAIDSERSGGGMMRLSEGDVAGLKEKLDEKTSKRTSSVRRQLENNIAEQVLNGMMQKMNRRQPTDFAVKNGAQSRGTLPADYQYPDGKPNEQIMPAVLFGDAKMQAGQRPSEALASWMTAPENPRFALTIANRMWARLLGAPFTGAVDSVRDVEDSPNPELSRYLTKVMVAARFDLRHFERIVANTRTYARQAGTLTTQGAAYDFAGPVLRRMSAEQAWDSLVTLAVPNVDAKMNFAAPDQPSTAEPSMPTGVDEIFEVVEEQAKEQAKEQLKAMRRYTPPPPRRPVKSFTPPPEFSPAGLVRASELPQPAPEEHFLRVFGQSNREIADGGWRSGTVPQTLAMLNSTLFDVLVQKGTPLYTTLARETGDSGRLRAVYLSILGRVPSIDEIRILSGGLHGTGNIEAIAHTLLGTRQFLFIQ